MSEESFQEEWGNEVQQENVFMPDEVENEDEFENAPAFDLGLEDDEDPEDGKEAENQRLKKQLQKKEGKDSVTKSTGKLVKKRQEESAPVSSRAGKKRDYDSEDDQVGARTAEDDRFIDDTGVDPAERVFEESDDERIIADAPQAIEEDDEIDRLFKRGRKRKNNELKSEIRNLIVEETMALMEKAYKVDADSNRLGEPAIQKLKALPRVKQALLKKDLHADFLDRGILSVLKNWLELLPDGSLPNSKIRTGILEILLEMSIGLDNPQRREQLKLSGLGKVVMFLKMYPDETSINRKLAQDVVDQWSREIFQKSMRYEDLKYFDEERARVQRPQRKEEKPKKIVKSNDDLNLDEEEEPDNDGKRARVPKPRTIDAIYRPESKVSEDSINNARKDARHSKITKALQRMARSKKQSLRAEKVSVEGRNLPKYI